MAPGMYRTKEGVIVQVSVTVDGHYMIRYPDGHVTVV